jgi:hypothetical protein
MAECVRVFDAIRVAADGTRRNEPRKGSVKGLRGRERMGMECPSRRRVDANFEAARNGRSLLLGQ